MIIYLVRHGQTTGDIENRYGGDYDDHLTEFGRQQVAEVAEKLRGQKIEKLYASPKIRAREAAAIVGDTLGLPVMILEGFRERNGYGVMTGMVKEEAAKIYPSYVQGLKTDIHFNVAGAETYDDFRQRITTALENLCLDDAPTVAVITHGGPIRLLFRDILRLGEIDIKDCAYTAVEARFNKYRLLTSDGIRIINHTA